MRKSLAISIALLMLCCHAQARKVSGIVTAGEEKLQGVIVTDGTNFTQTKKNGKFKFEIEDDADFVFIITPSGYVADWSAGVPAFYREAAGTKKFVFDLIPMEKSDDYSFIAMADPQNATQENFDKFMRKPMADLCETTKSLKGNAVGLVLGDVCGDNFALMEAFKKEILRTGIPFYAAIGNHDHNHASEGDRESSAEFRRILGPENYAFFLGGDLFIVLDNIIYEKNYNYHEGYTAEVLNWVRELERMIPADTDIYVAQHAPVRFILRNNAKLPGASDLIDILRGRKVTFISGHEHINNIFEHEEDIIEHNVAGFCGYWWSAPYSADGTPLGYKVFTKKDGRLEWYYKSVGHPKDFQMELLKPGQAPLHPNSVVLNVWDWDPQWKLEWYEDGKHMGKMRPVKDFSPAFIMYLNESAGENRWPSWDRSLMNNHYFAATPDPYAKNVTVAVENRFGQRWVYDVDLTECVDVQAHRGGAGLKPENTIEAMKNALDMGVNTLEFDLQVTADGQVVVSHDPYLIRDGRKLYIYELPYGETGLPLAGEMIDFAENYTREMGYSPVRYNIEIKSVKGVGEGQDRPTYDAFATICCKLLNTRYLDERLVVQSFDVRALNYIHEKYPELILSYLVDDDAPDFDEYMKKLKFTPQWLSPHHSLVNEELVKKCREKGIRIVPWTVNEPEDIGRLIDLGVDAIISDYPDRVLLHTRGF